MDGQEWPHGQARGAGVRGVLIAVVVVKGWVGRRGWHGETSLSAGCGRAAVEF